MAAEAFELRSRWRCDLTTPPCTLTVACILLVALTVGDGVLVVILFDTWGEEYSLFINQGTAFVYIIWATILLLLRREQFFGGAPAFVLIAIGLMNGSANFFMAVSQPHTPGLSQTLLSLLVIPLVLALTWLFLGRRPSLVAFAGAGLIVAGTAASSLRSVLDTSTTPSPITAYAWAVALFAAAQLFLAGEKVFEESVFSNSAAVTIPMVTGDETGLSAHTPSSAASSSATASSRTVRPMQMFLWTLVTQFILGWGLYPLQALPELGGVHTSELPALVRNGKLPRLTHLPKLPRLTHLAKLPRLTHAQATTPHTPTQATTPHTLPKLPGLTHLPKLPRLTHWPHSPLCVHSFSLSRVCTVCAAGTLCAIGHVRERRIELDEATCTALC